jgi:hypothetical protein
VNNTTIVVGQTRLRWSAATNAAKYRVCFNRNIPGSNNPIAKGCTLTYPFQSNREFVITQVVMNAFLSQKWFSLSIGWKVQACTQNNTECAVSSTFRTLNTPGQVTNTWFSHLLKKTFEHSRCVNCHRFAQTGNHAFKTKPGAQAWHVAKGFFSAGTDITVSSNCSGCHTQATNWHAPHSGIELHSKSTAQLCQRARTAPGTTPANHLKQDPLI